MRDVGPCTGVLLATQGQPAQGPPGPGPLGTRDEQYVVHALRKGQPGPDRFLGGRQVFEPAESSLRHGQMRFHDVIGAPVGRAMRKGLPDSECQLP